MDEEDIRMEAEEVAGQLGNEEEKKGRSPIWWIVGVFLVLLIILLIVPQYGIKLDPNPTNIPKLSDVTFLLGNETGTKLEANNMDDYKVLVSPTNPKIKLIADRIVSESCEGNKVCHAKALFFFVRDNLDYVSDPSRYEYVKDAILSLQSEGGDCDDASVLLATLLEAVGIRTRFVFIPGHVYIEAFLPEALNRYRSPDRWVTLDATCKDCGFGEIPYSTAQAQKIYIST
jgi:hypothetical protein